MRTAAHPAVPLRAEYKGHAAEDLAEKELEQALEGARRSSGGCAGGCHQLPARFMFDPPSIPCPAELFERRFDPKKHEMGTWLVADNLLPACGAATYGVRCSAPCPLPSSYCPQERSTTGSPAGWWSAALAAASARMSRRAGVCFVDYIFPEVEQVGWLCYRERL